MPTIEVVCPGQCGSTASLSIRSTARATVIVGCVACLRRDRFRTMPTRARHQTCMRRTWLRQRRCRRTHRPHCGRCCRGNLPGSPGLWSRSRRQSQQTLLKQPVRRSSNARRRSHTICIQLSQPPGQGDRPTRRRTSSHRPDRVSEWREGIRQPDRPTLRKMARNGFRESLRCHRRSLYPSSRPRGGLDSHLSRLPHGHPSGLASSRSMSHRTLFCGTRVSVSACLPAVHAPNIGSRK